MLVTALVLAVVVVVAAAALAWSKGYPAYLGSLLVAVLPFAGIIIVFMLPKRQRKNRRSA